jgi:hypothetical protein
VSDEPEQRSGHLLASHDRGFYRTQISRALACQACAVGVVAGSIETRDAHTLKQLIIESRACVEFDRLIESQPITLPK